MSTNTYWNHNGLYETAAKELRKLIPDTGSVPNPRSKNKALEQFRKACNCYYDLYNNGLCNRASEFARVIGITPHHHRVVGSYGKFFEHLYTETETAMNRIVLAAAQEQGLLP